MFCPGSGTQNEHSREAKGAMREEELNKRKLRSFARR